MGIKGDSILWLYNLSGDDIHLAGKKATKLAELYNSGIPVPEGFVITTTAYLRFLNSNKLLPKIQHLLGSIEHTRPESYLRIAQYIKKYIMYAEISDELLKDIYNNYLKISNSLDTQPVNIYSTTDTGSDTSAGFENTDHIFNSVKGDANLILSIKNAWADNFTAQKLALRERFAISHFKYPIALLIQKMPDIDKYGYLYTINPINDNKREILIDAKSSTSLLTDDTELPEIFIVSRDDLLIKSRSTSYKPKTENNKIKPAAKGIKQNYLLDDLSIIKLAENARKIGKLSYFPQKITWAADKKQFYILNTEIFDKPDQKKEILSATIKPVSNGLDQFKNNKIATKIYLNSSNSNYIKVQSDNDCNAVIIDASDIIKQKAIHPKYLSEEDDLLPLINDLSQILTSAAQAIYPKAVLLKLSSMSSADYKKLSFGSSYEAVEKNPLIGYRGASRLLHDYKLLKLEIDSVKMARKNKNSTNISIIIPFVRRIEELIGIKKLLASENLYRSSSFKIWMEIAVPANIYNLEDYIKIGIDGFFVDAAQLAELILGTDKENENMAQHYNETDKAVISAIEIIITKASKANIPVVINSGSLVYDQFIMGNFIRMGVNGIATDNADINYLRDMLLKAEQKLISL